MIDFSHHSKVLAQIKSCLFHIRNMYSIRNARAQKNMDNVVIIPFHYLEHPLPY
jgi:hypothetical protein